MTLPVLNLTHDHISADPGSPERVEVISPVLYENWDRLVLTAPGTTVFHTSAWASVLSASYGYSPIYFSTFGKGTLTGVLPLMEVRSLITGHRGVCLPFTDFCDPCAVNRPVFNRLFGEAIGYGKRRGWRFIEVRGGRNFLPDATPSVRFLNHVLKLSPDTDRMFGDFRKGTKSAIHKAAKELTVDLSTSPESIDIFYRLQCMTRKRHGLPPQPYRFFKLLHEQVIGRGMGFIVLARHKGTPIAGAIFLHAGDKGIYKYAASDVRYRHLSANNLVLWEAIKWYGQNDYDSFWFGRTERENAGLRLFKLGWGTTESVVNYYRYDIRKRKFVSPEQKVTNLEKNVFSRLPLSLLRLLGLLLYRHMG